MGLESFRFSALATELSDESGLAMAEAVATARSLQARGSPKRIVGVLFHLWVSHFSGFPFLVMATQVAIFL